jgi:hypothetical protein
MTDRSQNTLSVAVAFATEVGKRRKPQLWA